MGGVASIGGAGTFDGIFLTGIIALLLVWVFKKPKIWNKVWNLIHNISEEIISCFNPKI